MSWINLHALFYIYSLHAFVDRGRPEGDCDKVGDREWSPIPGGGGGSRCVCTEAVGSLRGTESQGKGTAGKSFSLYK